MEAITLAEEAAEVTAAKTGLAELVVAETVVLMHEQPIRAEVAVVETACRAVAVARVR